MKCRDYELQVQDFLDNNLDDKEKENFINHVMNCPRCYDELEIYFSIYRGIGRANTERLVEDTDFEPDGTTKDLDNMLEQMLKEIESKKFNNKLLNVFVISIFVVVFLLGLFLVLNAFLNII